MTLYGLYIAIAVFLGFYVTLQRGPQFEISRKDTENLFLISVPFAIIGARAYHILTEFFYYQKNLIETLYFWQGGWGIYGAIAGGVLGVFIYTRFREVNFWRVLDFATPGVVLGQAIGRFGNIINHELLPYAIYESILDFVIFLFFTFNFSLLTFHFSTYAILYGAGRFFLEFLRTESTILLGLKLNQIVSALFVVFGLYLKTQNSNVKSTSQM